MSESLNLEEIEQLSRFIGYGRLDAPIWFLGLEESLGKRPSMREWTPIKELKIRAGWPAVLDVKRAHQTLQDDYWNRRNYSSVWRFAAKLTVGILYPQISWNDTHVVHKYVINKLGREDGETLLSEVMPFPAKNLSDWPFISIYSDRKKYMDEMLPMRVILWKNMLCRHRPSVLFAYGKQYWSHYKGLFGLGGWKKVSKKIESKKVDESFVYLMPFFGNGQLSNQDVEAVIDDFLRTRG